MKICDEKQEAKQKWTLGDFKPGNVFLSHDDTWMVLSTVGAGVEFDPNGSFPDGFPAQRLTHTPVITWFRPGEINARYPNACLKLGEPEERP